MSFHYSIDGGSSILAPASSLGASLPLQHEDQFNGISRGFPSPSRMRAWSARGGRRRGQRTGVARSMLTIGSRSGSSSRSGISSLTGTSILLQSDGSDGGRGGGGSGQLDGCHSLQFNSLQNHRHFRNQQRAEMEERELNIARAITTRAAPSRSSDMMKASVGHYRRGNYTLSSGKGKQSRILKSSFRPRSAAAVHSRQRRRRKRDPASDYLRTDPFSRVKFPERTQLMMRRELRKKEEHRLQELRKRMDFSGDERAALHPQLYASGEF